MSKKAKTENKARRRQAKTARKKANYIRTGPKVGSEGKRSKRSGFNTFKPGKPRETPIVLTHKTASGKRRTKRMNGHTIGHKNTHAHLPLLPLRKRFHLGSSEAGKRMEEKRNNQGM